MTQIPELANFKPREIKTFTVTGTAGNAGEVYGLWANVEAPEGFRDENIINNTAVSSIKVVKQPDDDPDAPDNLTNRMIQINPTNQMSLIIRMTLKNLMTPIILMSQKNLTIRMTLRYLP